MSFSVFRPSWRRQAAWVVCVLFLYGYGASRALHAAEIVLPLTVRFDLLTQKLAQAVYTRPGGIAPVWYESDCRYLYFDHPQFGRHEGYLRFTTHGAGNFGTEVLGKCLSPLHWRGYIEVLTAPYLTADWQLHLQVVESNLYDEEWNKGLLTGLMWEVIERSFLPQLMGFAINLAPPKDDILFLVRTAVPPSEAAQVEAMLHSVTAKGVEVHDKAVVVPLALTVPDAFVHMRPPPAQPEAPFSPAELEAYQRAMERWDAFLVFVIKGVGADVVDTRVREELFDLLLASRYELLPVLSGEVTRGEGDPVRRVFIETWKRLREIVQEAERRGLLGDNILRYAGFIEAGDALLALEQAAPGLGIEISADGLRRLARILRPDAVEDPLLYSTDVDPTLRSLFGLPAELPAMPAPVAPTSLGSFRWLPVAYATAGEPEGLAALRERLDRWVPQASELTEYRPTVERLLHLTSDGVLQDATLEAPYVSLYRHLVPATALQESCWRQFERKGDKILPVTSAKGSIGLMQINRYVWRGFYNIERLKWDPCYNARAGGEILMRYLRQYGIGEGKRTGNPENSARATYAVYNAGPKAVSRYRARNATARERQVDTRFWELYRGFVSGGEVDLTACTVERKAEKEVG